jgi:hypothetical protein
VADKMGLFNSFINGLQQASKNIDDNRELKKKKTRILHRLTLRQLQYMVKNYNLRVRPAALSIDEKKLTIDDYIACVRDNLSYEEILDYTKRRNIDISDILQEKKEENALKIRDISSMSKATENQGNNVDVVDLYNNIKQKIETFELDFAVQSEADFEKHLYQYLKYNFPNFDIERQFPCGDGRDKVDLVINVPDPVFKVGIELKLATDRNHLRNARAQVEDYSKSFNFTLLVVMDIGRVEADVYKDIETKINVLNIDLIILKGQLIEKKSMEVKKKEKIIKELVK